MVLILSKRGGLQADQGTKRLLALVTMYITVSPLRRCLYTLYSLVIRFLFREGACYEHLQTWEELVLRFSVSW